MTKIILYPDNSSRIEYENGESILFPPESFNENFDKFNIKERRVGNDEGTVVNIGDVQLVIFPSRIVRQKITYKMYVEFKKTRIFGRKAK